MDKQWVLLNMVMNVRVLLNVESFVTCSENISLSRKMLLYEFY